MDFFWGNKAFYSIDLYGDELAQPIENFIPIYSRAKKEGLRLNMTPTSNVMLGRVKSMHEHPIAELYRNGVDVTINSDDVLLFDSDVSKEYLRLYESECLTAEELDEIRRNGLMQKR